jgi:phytoene synthase
MNFEAMRAEEFFAEASRILPPEDRRVMLPAEIMHSVYHRLLEKMRSDNFRVLEKKYRLGRVEKMWRVVSQLLNRT